MNLFTKQKQTQRLLNEIMVAHILSCFRRVKLLGTHPMDYNPLRLLCPWDSPGKNTGVGYHALLQGIFPTQGSNPRSHMSPALAGRFFTTRVSSDRVSKECMGNEMLGW